MVLLLIFKNFTTSSYINIQISSICPLDRPYINKLKKSGSFITNWLTIVCMNITREEIEFIKIYCGRVKKGRTEEKESE